MKQKIYHLCLAYHYIKALAVLQLDTSDYSLRAALLQPSKQHSNSTPDESSSQPFPCSSQSLTPTKQQYGEIEEIEHHSPYWSPTSVSLSEGSHLSAQILAEGDAFLTALQLCSGVQKGFLTQQTPCLEPPRLSARNRSLPETNSSLPETVHLYHPHFDHMDPTPPSKRILTDISCKLLRKATASCQTMKLLEHHILHGWPPSQEHLPFQFQAFWDFCVELAVADGILLKSVCYCPFRIV